jgi:hypothetical protein
MLNIEESAQNNPSAIIAVPLVWLADILFEVLPQAKNRHVLGYQFPLPDLASWFRMYHFPRKLLVVLHLMIIQSMMQVISL